VQERVVREIRMLRAMWRALETESRSFLNGHEGGNAGYSQGTSYGFTRQRSTLPGAVRNMIQRSEHLRFEISGQKFFLPLHALLNVTFQDVKPDLQRYGFWQLPQVLQRGNNEV
jgi:hypothetical protein